MGALLGTLGVARAVDTFFVANHGTASFGGYASGAVLGFHLTDNGNVAPDVNISGASTGLATGASGPQGLAIDSSGNIWVSQTTTVRRFSAGSDGDVAPAAIITGASTTLNGALGLAIDDSGNLWVANASAHTMVEFSAANIAGTGNLNIAPTVTITPTGTFNPAGIAVDHNGRVIITTVTGTTNAVYIWNSGNTTGTPDATITGAATTLSFPEYLFVDAGNNIWVANNNANTVLEFLPTDNGNVLPTIRLGGAATLLGRPYSAVVNKNTHDIWVVDNGTAGAGASFLQKFAAFATPNATQTVVAPTPAAMISGQTPGPTPTQTPGNSTLLYQAQQGALLLDTQTATPTATSSPTATFTATPTFTPTFTATATFTPTFTPTATATPAAGGATSLGPMIAQPKHQWFLHLR